jgi:hypothetical protein
MMIALENGRPDRLPCQVHGWMEYYLNHYLGGIDWYQACEKFDMDYAIYVSPDYVYDEKDQANWIVDHRDLGVDDHPLARFANVVAVDGDRPERRAREHEEEHDRERNSSSHMTLPR